MRIITCNLYYIVRTCTFFVQHAAVTVAFSLRVGCTLNEKR